MANDDKTEPATPKRRDKARKKGQVARSQDLGSAIVMIGGLIALAHYGSAVVTSVGQSMHAFFGAIARPDNVASGAGLNGIEHVAMNTVIAAAAPIGIICLAAGLLVNFAQVGFHPSLEALKPDFKRINPTSGWKNIFGPRIFFEAAKAISKVTVVGVMVALALLPQLSTLAAGVGMPPAMLIGLAGHGALGISEHAAAAYLVIALIDYAWQKRRHEKQLRMSKQEVKDEAKQQDLPPEIRSAIRRRQMQAARARMMAAIPQADVVVTNPTHFAVALKYDGLHPAPIVVAKGKDLVALQIRRIAEENNVPVMSDPPLARALHRSVEIGQLIPEDLYEAVAQVLAFVYRMARRRKMA